MTVYGGTMNTDINIKSRSITKKIVITIFIVCLSALLVAGLIIVTTVNERFTGNEKEILNESAQSISNKAEVFFERYIAIVEQMAQDKNIQNFMINAQVRNGTIAETEGFMPAAETTDATQKADSEIILTAYISQADYSLSSPESSAEGYDVTSKEYYKAVTENKVWITEPYVDMISGGIVITISAPVNVDSVPIGLTAVDIAIDKLITMVDEYELGDTGYFSLLTNNNSIVAHKDKDILLKSIDEIELSSNIVELVKNRDSNVAEYTYNNVKYYGSCMEIGDTGWQVLSALPASELTADTNKLVLTIVIIFIILLVSMLMTILAVVRRVTKPIRKITDITNKLAAGELDVNIDVHSNDEIGILAESIKSLTVRLKSYISYIEESVNVLDEMADGKLDMEFKNDHEGEFAKLKESLLNVSNTLKDTIGKIKDSSNLINMNADQVSAGAQTLAQGTTEQASAIEELSAEINEIYTTIVHNAENAENAGSKALETSKEVEQGNMQMKEMLSAMDEISNSSSEIGKIIKVIDDIAFQTNILALNAAVEAARAGSAGKGFAVVADEVGNLAGKSAEAAKQTTALIENSIKAINNGTMLAGRTGKSLAEIVNKTNKTNELINEIVKASSRQTDSVNQIKGGIEQISSVVQENAATAESGAANSEELSGQAQLLNELVNRFEI